MFWMWYFWKDNRGEKKMTEGIQTEFQNSMIIGCHSCRHLGQLHWSEKEVH